MHSIFHDHADRYSGDNALTLAELAAAVYLPPDALNHEVAPFEPVRSFDCLGTTAVVLRSAVSAIVSFRGTELALDDWYTDARIRRVRFAIGGVHLGGVHLGFREALAVVEDDVMAVLATPELRDRPLWLTGHSLGGALAVLLAARLRVMGRPIQGVYTFGQPRVGNYALAATLDQLLAGRHFRLVNGNDPVPRVPPKSLGYASSGFKLLLGADGAIKPVETWWDELKASWATAEQYWATKGVDLPLAHSRHEYVRCLKLAHNLAYTLQA